jgi:hypothetical protein
MPKTYSLNSIIRLVLGFQGFKVLKNPGTWKNPENLKTNQLTDVHIYYMHLCTCY